jgi:hypothetical protein
MPTRHRQPAARSLPTTLQVLATVGLIAVALAAPWPAPAVGAVDGHAPHQRGRRLRRPVHPHPRHPGRRPRGPITGPRDDDGRGRGRLRGPPPALRGFYLQDPIGDGDPATSDGIFVFNGRRGRRELGDRRPRAPARPASSRARRSSRPSRRSSPAGTGTVEPVDVTLPPPHAGYLERYEGMLVRLPQTLVVTEHFQLGRFGQVVLSSGGRLWQPTQVARPARRRSPQAANDRNRILAGRRHQRPEPRPDRSSVAAASRSARATRCAAATPSPAWSACSPTAGRATPPAATPTACVP